MTTRYPGFPPEARTFLADLKANNNRDWFQPRKEIFEQKVKAPLTELVLALGEALRETAPELETDPKKAIYRIYRDVRFSHDKSPYKTHVAAIFGPRGVCKHAGAGTYFHFSADEVLVAGGVYEPGSPELLAVRRHLAENADDFRDILANRAFRRTFGDMVDERLKRVPKGFSAGHPAADLLVYKRFIVVDRLPPDIVETPKFHRELLKRFALMLPFIRFLNRPLKPSLAMKPLGRLETTVRPSRSRRAAAGRR